MSYPRLPLITCLLTLCLAGCGSSKECMPGTRRCNSENNVELCRGDYKSWEFNKKCPKVQTCRGGQCLVVPKSCGNGKCDPKGENCNICPADCGACCGNGKCEKNYGEDRYTCKNDCKPLDKGVPPGDQGTTPPGDGAPSKKDKGGGVKPCQPGAVFCVGSEIRKCSADGKSASVQQDCKKHDFTGVSYSCKQCSSGKPGCEPNKKPFISGFSNGKGSFKYSYNGYFTCEKQVPFASVMFQGSTFNHMVTPNGNGKMPIFSINIKNIASGQQYILAMDSSGGTPPIVVSLTRSTSPAVTCSNVYPSINPPPSQGWVKVTYAGTSKGSTIKITASGHLLCYESGQQKWEQFAYSADGIVF